LSAWENSCAPTIDTWKSTTPMRDTRTTRENYVVASRDTGVKRNRKRVLVASSEVVAVARIEDVVDV
jgi:hypothetical protein